MSEGKRLPDIGERRAEAQAGVPLRSVCMALAAFFVVAGVLNGRHLNEGASRRPYGLVRKTWMMATTPFSRAATFLRADQLRDTIEKIRENEQ